MTGHARGTLLLGAWLLVQPPVAWHTPTADEAAVSEGTLVYEARDAAPLDTWEQLGGFASADDCERERAKFQSSVGSLEATPPGSLYRALRARVLAARCVPVQEVRPVWEEVRQEATAPCVAAPCPAVAPPPPRQRWCRRAGVRAPCAEQSRLPAELR